MKIAVKAHPKSKQEKIVQINDREYELYFNVPAEAGRANKKIVEMLAEHFGVSLSDVTIILGSKSKNKLVEIKDDCEK